jgi:hypothetical protein
MSNMQNVLNGKKVPRENNEAMIRAWEDYASMSA